MSKKPKKKKTEPSGFGILKPSFEKLWRQAVDGIKTLEEDHSEEYWARAAKEKYVPLLFPRRKKEQLVFWKTKLVEKGLRKTGRTGRPFLYGGVFQKEVESIYRSLMEERLQLAMRVKFKKTTKLKDISKEEKALLDLPPYGRKTWKKWWPLFLSRFMKKYDDKPEQHTKFYENVNDAIEGQELPDPLPSDSLYREAIKDRLEGVVESYANQPYELRT